MWFGRNQKRIKLSRRLKWSIGKGQHANKPFWVVGTLCLAAAGALITQTNKSLQNEAHATAPQVLGASIVAEEQPPALQFKNYEVSRGETLFTISQKFDVPTETLAQLNDIRPPFTLKAGQTIKIPAP